MGYIWYVGLYIYIFFWGGVYNIWVLVDIGDEILPSYVGIS